jgi:hypothetical protein
MRTDNAADIRLDAMLGIVFSTFSRCMSFYTAWTHSGHAMRPLSQINAAGRGGVWLPSMVVPQGCKAVNRRPVAAVG